MQFDNSFAVRAPIEDVWTALLDVERVAPCVPGAQVLEQTGEDAYKVGIKVKLGPMSMQYRGQLEIVEKDAAQRRALMKAKAKEARGQGTADATVRMLLRESGELTEGTISTDVQLSGKAAAMGQGVIQDVSAKLLEMFAANLATMLSDNGASAAAATNGGHSPASGEAPSGVTAAPAAGSAATAGPAAIEPTAPSQNREPAPAAAGRPPMQETSLPIMSILSSVLVGRMQSTKVLVATLTIVFALGLLIGRVLP